MSEVNLSALAAVENDRNDDEAKAPTPMKQVNSALEACGFGLFHIRLLFSTFVMWIASVLCTNTTSYLLPSAECDLDMNLVQKGLLNAMPYIGMIFSSAIAGFLTDTFGRKVFITGGLAGCFFFSIISASSQTYEVLVTSKFCEGLVFGGYFTASLTLSSEFCHDGIRDWILIFQSSYASIAQILIAVMSWGILPNDWRIVFFDGRFVLNTWNFYLYVMSLWSLVGCILYMFIPESPKYLVSKKRYDEARNVLLYVYNMNTGKSEDTYPFKDLWKKLPSSKLDEVQQNMGDQTPSNRIVVALHSIKPLFQRPLVTYLILICLMNFSVMSEYNTFRLWFPQVSTIVEYNSFTTENGLTQDLCMMLDTYTANLHEEILARNSSTVCIPKKSGTETYVNSIIIGAVCTIPYFVSGILVAKIGKKPLMLVFSLIACASTMGLRYADSKVAVVSLFALAIAITQSAMSMNQVSTLEYLPTNVRSLGIAVMMSIGRMGTLGWNILFPVLLKMGCVIPFYTMACMMMSVVVMMIFLPTKKKT